jgi:hypothetical protein
MKMQATEKKIIIVIVAMIIIMGLCIYCIEISLTQAAKEIDSHGGLKSMVHRIWNGK